MVEDAEMVIVEEVGMEDVVAGVLTEEEEAKRGDMICNYIK
jgi:hypothetical protein